MIKVKHLMEAVEADDGMRIWVEPIGLTRDLAEWCSVQHIFTHLGPPMKLWRWFDQHPQGYEHFRGRYHEHLARGRYTPALRALAKAGESENFTLLHTGDDPAENCATAFYEYISELSEHPSE